MKVRLERARAVAHPGSSVATQRGALFRAVYARISDARKAGFHLEAITLTESMLADRLESRLAYLGRKSGGDSAFKTLETLVRRLTQTESDATMKRLVAADVSNWKDERNQALHEMAKIEEGDGRVWSSRLEDLPGVSLRGLKVLRAVDGRMKVLRRSGG